MNHPDLSRTATRLLVAADTTPRSLDDIQGRAGYTPNDARPFYREHADDLVQRGLFAAHAPSRTGRHPRYSRTAEGEQAVPGVLAARPALRPLTKIDPATGRPCPLPDGLTDASARLLLAFADLKSATLSKAIEHAGYAGDVTEWFRREFARLTFPYYVTADLGDNPERPVYRITPAGEALAAQIEAARPGLPGQPRVRRRKGAAA